MLVDEMELLVDLLPGQTHVLVLDPERVRRRAHDLVATSEEFLGASWAAAASGGEAPIDLGAASYRALGDVRAHALAPGQSWWTVSPFGLADDAEVGALAAEVSTSSTNGTGGADPHAADAGRRRLPRRRRPGLRRPRALAGRGLPHGRRAPRPRPRPAHRRGARRARRRGPAGRRARGRARRRRGHRDLRLADPRLRRRGQQAGAAHRRGHLRPARVDPRHAQDAGPPQAPDRPARARRRRLRRPRAARRRPVRRDEAARGRRRDPRIPRPGVRRLQARRPAGPALRPGRRARPGHPLRRRRAAQPRPARRRRLGQAQGPGPQGGPPDRGRADQALRRPAGHQGPRVRPGHPVAARARGRLPVQRDPRPADHGRRGQGRHDEDRPDGPAGLRRRRLRQDRDRGARGVQGGPGRQAGRRPGADHAAGDPAPLDVPGADERLPDPDRGAQPVPDRQGGPRGHRRPRRRHGRHRGRHPPAAQPGHPGQGPRADHRRRGAAVRRRAQGADEAAPHLGRRPVHVGDPDPAHPGDGDHRHPRDVDDHHPARGAAPGADLRRRLRGPPGHRRRTPRAAARGPGLLHPQPGAVDREGRRQDPRAGARGAGRGRPRPDGGAPARAGDARLLGEDASTCWSARRSSSPASTSPTPTR